MLVCCTTSAPPTTLYDILACLQPRYIAPLAPVTTSTAAAPQAFYGRRLRQLGYHPVSVSAVASTFGDLVAAPRWITIAADHAFAWDPHGSSSLITSPRSMADALDPIDRVSADLILGSAHHLRPAASSHTLRLFDAQRLYPYRPRRSQRRSTVTQPDNDVISRIASSTDLGAAVIGLDPSTNSPSRQMTSLSYQLIWSLLLEQAATTLGTPPCTYFRLLSPQRAFAAGYDPQRHCSACFVISIGYFHGGQLELRPPHPQRQLERHDIHGHGMRLPPHQPFRMAPSRGFAATFVGYHVPRLSFDTIVHRLVSQPYSRGNLLVADGGRPIFRDPSRALPSGAATMRAHYLGSDRRYPAHTPGNKVFAVTGPCPPLDHSASARFLHDGVIRHLDVHEIARLFGLRDHAILQHLFSLPSADAIRRIVVTTPPRMHFTLYDAVLADWNHTNALSLILPDDFLRHHLRDNPSPTFDVHHDFFHHCALTLVDNTTVDLPSLFAPIVAAFVDRIASIPAAATLNALLAHTPAASEPIRVDKRRRPPHVADPSPLPAYQPGSRNFTHAVARSIYWHRIFQRSADAMQRAELAGDPHLRHGDHRYAFFECPACQVYQDHAGKRQHNPNWHPHEIAGPGQVIHFDISYPSVKDMYKGYKYLCHFVCASTFHKWIFPIKHLDTSSCIAALLYLVNVIRIEYGIRVRTIVSDAFSSFLERDQFTNFKLDTDVKLSTVPRHHHHSNLAENSIRQTTRDTVINLQALKGFRVNGKQIRIEHWVPHAAYHAITAHNHVPNARALRLHNAIRSARQLMSQGRLPALTLHPFGEPVTITYAKPADSCPGADRSTDHIGAKHRPKSGPAVYLAPHNFSPFTESMTEDMHSSDLLLADGRTIVTTIDFTVNALSPAARQAKFAEIRARFPAPATTSSSPAPIPVDDPPLPSTRPPDPAMVPPANDAQCSTASDDDDEEVHTSDDARDADVQPPAAVSAPVARPSPTPVSQDSSEPDIDGTSPTPPPASHVQLPSIGDYIDVFWPGHGWDVAKIMPHTGRMPNSGRSYTRDLKLKSNRGTRCPKHELFVIQDSTGEFHTKHLNPQQHGKTWRTRSRPKTKANHFPSFFMTTLTLLVAHAHIHPGYSELLRRDVPLRRTRRPQRYSQKRTFEDARSTREYAQLGGTVRDLRRECADGSISLQCGFLSSEQLESVLLSKEAKLDYLRDDPDLPDTERAARAADRAFCAEAAHDLFGDAAYADLYCALALFHTGFDYDSDGIPHMFRHCDPEHDCYHVLDSIDLTSVDQVCLQFTVSQLGADDIEYTPEKIQSLREFPESERADMIKAIHTEVGNLCERGTFSWTVLPPDRKAMNSKLVLKIKYRADGSRDKSKARLCAVGCSGIPGIDFYASSSPMVLLSSCRALISIAVHHNLPIGHLDVPQAFIQTPLDREIYIRFPMGISIKGPLLERAQRENPDATMAIRLLKSLYGLRQAGLTWYQNLREHLESLGFKASRADTCLYQYEDDTGWAMITTSVDDLLITGTHTQKIEEFKTSCDKKYGQGNWDPHVSSFLGINCRHDLSAGTFTFDASAKIRALLDKLGLSFHGTDCPTNENLFDAAFKQSSAKCVSDLLPTLDKLRVDFASTCGSLVYITLTTRPDIQTHISKICQGMHSPTLYHLSILHQLMRYLHKTHDDCLVYRRTGNPIESSYQTLMDKFRDVPEFDKHPVIIFADADFADSRDPRLRSTSGYAAYLHGNLINWSSKRQTLTAKSTMQAELVAAAAASDEGVWYFQFQQEHAVPLGLPKSEIPPVLIFIDNLSALRTSNHPTNAPANRHISLREFRIRDAQEVHQVRPLFVPTELNAADVFTKLLPRDLFLRAKNWLGVSGSKPGHAALFSYISTTSRPVHVLDDLHQRRLP